MTEEDRIVIIGAGVLGLTTAFQLCRKGYKRVSIVAQHLPSDNHPDYTSIWAGADYVPVSKPDTREAQWDREGWEELAKLAETEPGAGVSYQDRKGYYHNGALKQEDFQMWWKDVVQGFRFLSREELPPFADWGTFYRTLTLDPSIYLHYLQSQCISLGVTFRRESLSHIRDAFSVHSSATADVVVNCTGLLASRLGGVMDDKVVPVRGQIVVVENESHGIFFESDDGTFDKGIGECCYIIPRPAGGGTALGGSSHITWDREPDMELSERIMKRAVRICPALVPQGAGIEALRVVRHQVGLRPVRIGGARVESEILREEDGKGKKLRVVHCYGAGGFGYQSSYGMANAAVLLVEEALGLVEN